MQPDWLVTRMQEEAMLESPRPDEREEAFERLVTLQENAEVPRLHRADIAHNLGAISEDAENRDHAIRWYQKALALNPFLESAQDGFARLGATAPQEP